MYSDGITEYVKEICRKIEGAHFRISTSGVPLIEFARNDYNGNLRKFSACFFARKNSFWIVFCDYMSFNVQPQKKFLFNSAELMVKRLNNTKRGGDIISWDPSWSPKKR